MSPAIIRPYVRTLAAAMPGRLGLAMVLTALGALTEGIALLVRVPQLHLIGMDVQRGSVGRMARSIATVFGYLCFPLNLISVLVLCVGLIAGDGWLRRRQTVTYCAIQVGFTAYPRKRLCRAVTRASWIQLTRSRASDLTHAMLGQVERIEPRRR
ncbi:MAG TPA: hypothetical protein VMS64_35785 [Candidatus Methylomirabilis sp.]|nr:hypothetical protein [Candidatus Methylomirabilis sp.]